MPGTASSASDRAHGSELPRYLSGLYALLIIYASLEPFSGWMAPIPGTPFFLWAGLPSIITRADVVINMAAYFPFGFFLASIGSHARVPVRMVRAVCVAAALSIALESAQMYLPTRDASVFDVLTNVAGAALGACAALAFTGSSQLRRAAARWRRSMFIAGKTGDLGLALLGIWMLAQFNPAIGLFAATFDPPHELAPDLVSTLLEAAQSAFHVIGVGLFLALLLRQRRYIGGAVLMLMGATLMLKGIAAAVLLRPAVWDSWLRPGVSLGVALGALSLLLAIWLPRPIQMATCAVALLSSLVAPRLASDLWQARPPLAHFDWSYGQLLNFNGLTHAVLIVWPVFASFYLLWLAGQPEWGHRGWSESV